MTPDDLQHIMGCSPERAATYCEPLNAAMRRFDITTPAQQAAFLAQVGHESARLVYVEELAPGTAYNGRPDLGNNTEDAFRWAGAALPGPYFKGHGLIQITGFFNHRDCSIALYPDDPETLLRAPRTLCQPADAAMSAGWFWSMLMNLNAPADSGSPADFELITRKINGGINGLADRQLLWAKAKEVLNA
jgi:putative chitinase